MTLKDFIEQNKGFFNDSDFKIEDLVTVNSMSRKMDSLIKYSEQGRLIIILCLIKNHLIYFDLDYKEKMDNYGSMVQIPDAIYLYLDNNRKMVFLSISNPRYFPKSYSDDFGFIARTLAKAYGGFIDHNYEKLVELLIRAD